MGTWVKIDPSSDVGGFICFISISISVFIFIFTSVVIFMFMFISAFIFIFVSFVFLLAVTVKPIRTTIIRSKDAKKIYCMVEGAPLAHNWHSFREHFYNIS